MSDSQETDEDDGSSTSLSPNAWFRSRYSSDLLSIHSLSSDDTSTSYNDLASSLEASISASAAPTTSAMAGGMTDYVGISGSIVTPVGGAEVDLGFYSDSYGLVGAYAGFGPAAGIPGGSLGIVSGSTQSLAGQSVNVSGGLSYGLVGVSKGYSADPTTGAVTGEQLSVGLSVGPAVGSSGSYTSTTTTEFTSLYLAYIQFLSWVGYPGNSPLGDPAL